MNNQAAKRSRRASDEARVAPSPPPFDRALATAIERDRIGVSFQPQIELVTGRVAGVEALARWSGAESAAELFARAAASNLAERLSHQVQRRALRAVAGWRGKLADLHLSLNLLPEELCRDGVDDRLLAEIAEAKIDPARVTVEITESSLLTNPQDAVVRLARLRDRGVRVAVDDFGTGYASLAYLTTLPIDILKIDQGLITGIVGHDRDRIVVRAMIRLAHELGLKVVVEGVETASQLMLLERWGCDLYQGFLGAGALNRQELERFVAASTSDVASAGP